MKLRRKEHLWPVVGLLAVGFSAWLLYHELRGLSLEDVLDSLKAIPLSGWGLAALSTLLAYAALAGYDRIALLHMDKKVPWPFIAMSAFTTYALAHNLGASVLSGAVVRYRAYTSRGLTAGHVGVLVAFCSLTFALGVVLLGGLVLIARPDLPARFYPEFPRWLAMGTGGSLLALVALYALASRLGLRPIRIRDIELWYPRLPVVGWQLLVAPLELIGAAGIIYFTLPAESNPGFLLVLGIFLASFSAALLSHAPGGLGVLEVVFLLALPEAEQADVIAALLVFRLFYLLIPLALALPVVVLFERAQLRRAILRRHWAERRKRRAERRSRRSD